MLPPQPREESASESKERVFSLKERSILFTVIQNNNNKDSNNNKSRVLLHASLVFDNTRAHRSTASCFRTAPANQRAAGRGGGSPPLVPSVFSGSLLEHFVYYTAGGATPRHLSDVSPRAPIQQQQINKHPGSSRDPPRSLRKVMSDKHALHSCLLPAKKKSWIYATTGRGER